MKKRLFALTLALAVCLSLFTPALAAEIDVDSFYGDQLKGAAQDMYNHLMREYNGLLNGRGSISYETSLSGRQEADKYVAQDTIDATIDAFSWDHPEIFWHGYWTFSWRSDDGFSYTITITPKRGKSWTSGGRSLDADKETLSAKIAEIADEARAAGSTWYEQLLYVHDWLTLHNRYNEEASAHTATWHEYYDSTPWRPISALVEDLDPLCEGYTRSFKLICDELGIPCLIVHGECNGPHLWNCVQMEDGQWYGVDVTFDDPTDSVDQAQQPLVSGRETNYYFLVGNNYKFSSHVADKRWAYPALSLTDYDPGAEEPAPAITSSGVEPQDSGTAYASTTLVNVDGREVEFLMYALRDESGAPTNYIKLRDLADILNGTAAQFNVGWTGAIDLETGVPYTTPDGSENKPVFQGDQQYAKCADAINVDGQQVDLKAFTLTIPGSTGGSNFFKLRDLGQALGFNVGWTAEKGLFVETDRPYDPAD